MAEERKGAVLPFGDRKPKKMGLDGIMRNPEEDEKLNSLFAATFADASGNAVLDYLESITIRTVNGPEASSDALRHMEGMRHMVSIILERTRLGKERR